MPVAPRIAPTAVLLPRVILCAAIVAGLPPVAAAAGVYRWVDENGRVQYGDKPPAGTEAAPVEIGKDNVSGDLEERRERRERMLDVMEEERAEEARVNAANARQASDRRRNCDTATEQLRKAEEAQYIYERTADPDNPRVLEDSERAAYEARARADVAKWCK